MRFPLLLSATATALVLAGCGQASPSTSAKNAASSDCGTGPVSSHLVRTRGYEMVAAAGPLEATYTRGQVAAQHPTTGEMMISGDMLGQPGMSMGAGPGSGMSGAPDNPNALGAYRHVEVHICDRASGRVVQNAAPAMSLTDTSGSGMTEQMPVAVMQGVRSGMADTHYGNNARMIQGHRYSLDVTVHGEHAKFGLGADR